MKTFFHDFTNDTGVDATAGAHHIQVGGFTLQHMSCLSQVRFVHTSVCTYVYLSIHVGRAASICVNASGRHGQNDRLDSDIPLPGCKESPAAAGSVGGI